MHRWARVHDASDGHEFTDVSRRTFEGALWIVIYDAMVLNVEIAIAIGFAMGVFRTIKIGARIASISAIG